MALGAGDAPSAAPAAAPPGRGAGHGGPQAALATARRARHAAPADTTDGRVWCIGVSTKAAHVSRSTRPSRVHGFPSVIDDPGVCPREGMSPLYTTRVLSGYGPLVSV